jgi:UDP-N-acetylglucosamine transferase subunit ALG13
MATMDLAPPVPACPYAFVTVGTTRFDDLVAGVFSDDFAAAVRDVWGLRCIAVQLGRGPPPGCTRDAADAPGPWSFKLAGDVEIVAFRLRPTLADLITGASLIVSHAGAGSVFEAVRARRPLCVVVNTALADNHQVELAVAMQRLGHAVHTVPRELCATLRRSRDVMLEHATRPPLPPPDGSAFVAAVTATLVGDMAPPGAAGGGTSCTLM